MGPWGPGFGGRGRPRARRGDVRAALLVLLAEEPRNGYGLMQEIESRSEGVWRPSPGSVYPALQQLEDEGLVRAEERDGSRVFTLTDEGRAYVEDNDLGAPWEAVRDEQGEDIRDIRGLIAQVAAAAWQVGQAGTEAQIAEARRLLAETRRALYRILSEDDEPEAR
jgi:DNA-binding PadR family transcriptional regulator